MISLYFTLTYYCVTKGVFSSRYSNLLRIAIVLGKDGGALQPLKRMTQLGLGGKQGSGNQYFSWIHEQDFINVVEFVMQNDSLNGVYNVSSPNPIKNEQVMRMLRKTLKMPFGIPSSKWMLELGARLIRTETELILKSRRVVPARLSGEGFKFQFPDLKDALDQLIK